MKKVRVGIICAAVALAATAIFTGCGSKGAKGGEDIIWYYVADSSATGNDEVFEKANEITKEKLGFGVEFNPIDPSAYEQKMKVIMSGGDAYDIAWTANWCNNYAQNVSNGAFMPLDDLLKDTPALKNSISDNIWEGTKIGGKIYGVPCQQIMARSTGAYIPAKYADKFDELVPEKITKYSQLTPYVEWLGKQNPGAANINLYWQDNIYMYGIEDILGTKVPGAIALEGDGEIKVFNQFESEQWLDCITARRDWYEKGATVQGKTNQTKSNYMDYERPMDISTYTPNGAGDRSKSMGFETAARQLSDAYLTTGGITSTLQAINVNSQNPENAMKLLELVNTDADFINLLSWGIEGVHYEKVSDKIVKKIENPATTYSVRSWRFGNVFNSYLIEGNAEDTWEKTKQINDTAKTSRILGFSADMEPIKTEINNCNSIVTEYMDKMNEGLVDPISTNKEMIEKLKLAGCDKIIAELQRQIDEWVKSK